MRQDLLADLRSRINPAYQDMRGTESYERKQCADAIESLQSKLGDAIRSLANWQHQCTELQAENERLKDERKKDAFRLVWAMNWMRMSVHDHGFTKHVLERGGTADYSDCATYIDKCTTATQETAHGIHAKGGQ